MFDGVAASGFAAYKANVEQVIDEAVMLIEGGDIEGGIEELKAFRSRVIPEVGGN